MAGNHATKTAEQMIARLLLSACYPRGNYGEPLTPILIVDNAYQSGFRAGCGTDINLAKTMFAWNTARLAGQPLCFLAIDMRKAFDSVPRDLLFIAL